MSLVSLILRKKLTIKNIAAMNAAEKQQTNALCGDTMKSETADKEKQPESAGGQDAPLRSVGIMKLNIVGHVPNLKNQLDRVSSMRSTKNE
jgi:hypothetical protein